MSTQENAKAEGPRHRFVISVVKLCGMIDEELQRARSPQCRTCQPPIPFFTERPDEHSANWTIGEPRHCELGCHTIIKEVVEQLAAEYDVSRAVWAPSFIR